jgi:hypothetical protein
MGRLVNFGTYLSTNYSSQQIFTIRLVGLLGTILSIFAGNIIGKIKLKGAILTGLILLGIAYFLSF